jgi:mannose-6-phosphate isomerase
MLYPLRFEPRFRHYLWGGRRLETILGKTLDEGKQVAESWEVVDHGEDQSIVAEGPLRGRSLGELRQRFSEPLFGRHAPLERFPLLFKFLDAQQNLSVQVHPDDATAARLVPPDYGKTEAWVVLHAEPESLIYAGLKRGFDRAALEREVHRGTAHLCLHSFHPQAGDCVFIPAGVVHALGAGLVIAEIQQSSDTTYRLYDWNRVGPDGQPRPLHVQQALAVIDYDYGPVQPQQPQASERPFSERLVSCDKFVLERGTLRGTATLGGDQRFHIVSVLSGNLSLQSDDAEVSLDRGQTALLPACLKIQLSAADSATFLDMFLP